LKVKRTEEASKVKDRRGFTHILFIIFLINLSLFGEESEFGKDFKVYLEGGEELNAFFIGHRFDLTNQAS
jgi:hypothetical protein